METVKVNASRSYDVLIGADILPTAGELISKVIPSGKAFIVSDDNVFPLYGETLKKSLEKAGFDTAEYVFPHGESSKNLSVYGMALEAMCSEHLTRSDFIVALGGGVVGDLAGFAAATYQRGVKFVQVPTTLLAAVDSSVGGKTAVDLPGGKNQVGCFYQPSLVVCDTKTFSTLPKAEYRNGCSEIIKYSVIGSKQLFDEISARPVSEQYETVIKACVAMKAAITEKDEFDLGCRILLNLGHTFGHAVETCSEYSVPHGQAVAVGMAAITRAAVKRGYCSEETLEDVLGILKKYGLETETDFSADELCRIAFNDKKGSGRSMTLVVPERIGSCVLEKISKDELSVWLKDGGIE